MRTLCLTGTHNVENISAFFEMLKEGKYDQIDASNAEVDHYVSILIAYYNENVEITPKDFPMDDFGIQKEFSYFFRLILFFRVLFKSCKLSFQTKYFYSNLVFDLYNITVESFLIVVLVSFIVGCNFGYQTYMSFYSYGLADSGMEIIVISCFRYVGVLIAFLILLTKYSSSLIAKVGFMRISEEWSALRIMRIDPEIFLLQTKIYSFIILMPFFAYVSILFTVFGAYIVYKILHGLTFKFFLSTAMIGEFRLLFAPLIKGGLMGVSLGLVSAYEATLIDKSSEKIVSALNHGVVSALVVCVIINVFMDFCFHM